MPRSHASAQALLPIEDISGDVLRLRNGECRGVLEAGSVNFALKSEAEQEAIVAGYRQFLNGLSYPLQVLVRIVPADVETYLAGLQGGRARTGGGAWRDLAADHEAFVRRVARDRTLLDRRCYVVVPAGTGATAESARRHWLGRRRARSSEASGLLTARRALAFRCAEVAQGLNGFGVAARRLDEAELVALWRASLLGVPTFRPTTTRAASSVLSRFTLPQEVSDA